MEKVEYLEDLKVGEFVYLFRKDGTTEFIGKFDSDVPEIKGRYIITQFPDSGNLRFISDKDWSNIYLNNFKISGSNKLCKEYTEI